MSLQEISHSNIASTLLSCPTIKIIFLTKTLSQSEQYKKFYEQFLKGSILYLKQHEIELKNHSVLTFIYNSEINRLCGVRADIVVIDDLINKNEIQEMAIPLVSSSWSRVMNGGPIFATGIYKLKN